MARIRFPLVDKQNNRTYLNTSDYLLLNAYVEHGVYGSAIVNRPGWRKKLDTTELVSSARGFTYSSDHSLFYCVIGDALFSIDTVLSTVTEIARKTPIAVTWGGGVAKYQFAAAHGFIAGQKVNVTGVTPAGYSGVLTILAVTTTTIANDSFTVTMADPGASTLLNARVSPILTSTGKVYFEQTKNSADTVTMLQIPKTASQNSQLFMIASGGVVTRVTDAQLPTDIVGAPISIDSYLFMLRSNSEVYNSDLEAPTSVNALGFVKADVFPDKAVTLARTHNQLVCFKEYSTEFFYDAAIEAPASPLAKIPQQTLTIGCASAATVVQIGNRVVWLSRNQNGGLAVHMMEGSSAQKISTPFIDRILASMESFVFGEKVESLYVSNEGHDFYILSIEGTIGDNQAIFGIGVFGTSIFGLGGSLNNYKRTLVFDLTEKLWHEWSTTDRTTGAQSVFFGAYSVSGPHTSNSQDFTNTLVMEKSTGDIYEMSPAPIGVSYGTTYKDGTRRITTKVVTNNLDGNTRNLKKCLKLEVLGDSGSGAIRIRYSDDDYRTWSDYRTVGDTSLSGDVAIAGIAIAGVAIAGTTNVTDDSSDPRLILFNLGSFRRRAFEFSHQDNAPLRLNAIELEVQQGTR